MHLSKAVQLFVALHAQARREEALAHQSDLVLDLTFFPARGRRAGDRIDEVVRTHPQAVAKSPRPQKRAASTPTGATDSKFRLEDGMWSEWRGRRDD